MNVLVGVAALGGLAFVVGKVLRRIVPEIVVFLAVGVVIGPEGPLSLLSEEAITQLNLVTLVALAAIIFRLGEHLRLEDLAGAWRSLLPLSLTQTVLTGVAVFAAVSFAGAEPGLAVVLALIAAETGVLTVTAVVREERTGGWLTSTMLSSVGLVNVAVAALFGLVFPFVLAATGEAENTTQIAQVFLRIVVASTALGFVGGWLLRRFGPDIQTSGELLLFLLLVLVGMAGIGTAIEGSVVVAALVAGLYVTNTAPWIAERFFAGIRTLEAPIYLVFFVVAGAGIHLDELQTVGLVGLAYVLSRSAGKILGTALGGVLAAPGVGARQGLRLGFGMLPHAGMAVALVAFVLEQSPALGEDVSAVVLGAIVVFELLGPLATRRALRSGGQQKTESPPRAGETTPTLEITRDFRRVLVPFGNLAVVLPRLPFLLDLVANLDAQLVAVHVSRPGSGYSEGDRPEVLGLVARMAAERNIRCDTVHRVSEQVAETLVEAARDAEVDLIVMGEPARSALFEPRRWGVIAQRVTAAVSCPVLVYPVDPSDPEDVPATYLRQASHAEAQDDRARGRAERRAERERREDGG